MCDLRAAIWQPWGGQQQQRTLAPGKSLAVRRQQGKKRCQKEAKRALKLACCHKSPGPKAASLKSPVHIHPTSTHGFTRQLSRTFFTSAPPTLRSFPSSHPSPLISPRTLSGTIHLFNTLAFHQSCDRRGVVCCELGCLALPPLNLCCFCRWTVLEATSRRRPVTQPLLRRRVSSEECRRTATSRPSYRPSPYLP